MKRDSLKEFVSRHRNDFDDQEPAADVLGKIQARLGLEQPAIAPRTKIIKFKYWWAAAALITVMVSIGIYFREHKPMEASIVKTTVPKPVVHPKPAGMANAGEKETIVKLKRGRIKAKDEKAGTAIDWQQALQSESSSSRLAAILSFEKRNTKLSDRDLQTLSYTMNNDENSNVRLAALDVLKKHEDRAAVKDLILESVGKQDDPVVQIELLTSLSSDEAIKVKQQLLDITQDPTNIDAVRNQAYVALLRSKTNF